HDLDALRKGDAGHATALAAAGQPQVGGVLLNGHELGMTAVSGDARVDLPVEHLEDPLGDVAAEVGRRTAGAGHAYSRARAVGVVEDEASLDRVARHVERRPPDLVDRDGGDDDRNV